MTDDQRPTTDSLRRRLAAAVLLSAVAAEFVACGGRERPPKPAAEGPDMEVAILTCNFERVKALVDEDPTVIDVKPRGRYEFPIALAASASRICGTQIFSYLLDQDPQMNVVLLTDALRNAARVRDGQMVAVLLQHGANPNGNDADDPDRYLQTPLMEALGGWLLQDPARRLEVAEQLVAAGARLNVPAAAAMGKVKALRSMLDHDPKLALARRPWERNPMEWAAIFQQRETARVLLEYIPNPSLTDMIVAGDERAVRDYLDHHPGAARLKIEIPGRYSRDYPITVAVRAGDRDIVKLLLDRGADPNTPWMMEEIVRRGDVEMVKFLIDHGADVKDKPGMPPLTDIAIAARHPEIADLIRQAQ